MTTKATVAFMAFGRRYDLEMTIADLPKFLAELDQAGFSLINMWSEVTV